jgi:hypothetical protein
MFHFAGDPRSENTGWERLGNEQGSVLNKGQSEKGNEGMHGYEVFSAHEENAEISQHVLSSGNGG